MAILPICAIFVYVARGIAIIMRNRWCCCKKNHYSRQDVTSRAKRTMLFLIFLLYPVSCLSWSSLFDTFLESYPNQYPATTHTTGHRYSNLSHSQVPEDWRGMVANGVVLYQVLGRRAYALRRAHGHLHFCLCDWHSRG